MNSLNEISSDWLWCVWNKGKHNFFTKSCMGKLSILNTWERKEFLSAWYAEPVGTVWFYIVVGLLILLHLIWIHRLHLSHFMAWWLLALEHIPQGNFITIGESEKGSEKRVSDMKKREKELVKYIVYT